MGMALCLSGDSKTDSSSYSLHNPLVFILSLCHSVGIFMDSCQTTELREGDPIPDIIEAMDLEKKFGDIIAVNTISFTVKKGEVFGFLGPNGAGKTSTMKIIACVSPRTSGTIRVFGMDRIRVRQKSNNGSGLFRRKPISILILPALVTCSLTHATLTYHPILHTRELKNFWHLSSYRKKRMLPLRNSPEA